MRTFLFIILLIIGSTSIAQKNELKNASVIESYWIDAAGNIHEDELNDCKYDLSLEIGKDFLNILSHCKHTVYSQSDFVQPLTYDKGKKAYTMVNYYPESGIYKTISYDPKEKILTDFEDNPSTGYERKVVYKVLKY